MGDKHRQPIFFLSSDPSSPRLLLLSKVSICGIPGGLCVVMALLLLFGQSGTTSTGFAPTPSKHTHTHTHTHRLIFVNCHEKKCLFHLFYLCANILLLLYIQLHTVDSVLCNKQIDSLPTVLLMLAIVGFQHLTHTALQWSN